LAREPNDFLPTTDYFHLRFTIYRSRFTIHDLPFTIYHLRFTIHHSRKEMSAQKQSQLEIYTDGQCPLCRWTRAKVEPFDTEKRLEWLDIHQPEVLARAAPLTLKELNAEVHVRRKADDRWFGGFAAWREILKALPRWRWLGILLGIFPFMILGEPFYRFIAKRRYTFFGVPPPCDAESGVCEWHGK
jgi:predicted DCC family thiol-disulfide oxidoreductase YuxK